MSNLMDTVNTVEDKPGLLEREIDTQFCYVVTGATVEAATIYAGGYTQDQQRLVSVPRPQNTTVEELLRARRDAV